MTPITESLQPKTTEKEKEFFSESEKKLLLDNNYNLNTIRALEKILERQQLTFPLNQEQVKTLETNKELKNLFSEKNYQLAWQKGTDGKNYYSLVPTQELTREGTRFQQYSETAKETTPKLEQPSEPIPDTSENKLTDTELDLLKKYTSKNSLDINEIMFGDRFLIDSNSAKANGINDILYKLGYVETEIKGKPTMIPKNLLNEAKKAAPIPSENELTETKKEDTEIEKELTTDTEKISPELNKLSPKDQEKILTLIKNKKSIDANLISKYANYSDLYQALKQSGYKLWKQNNHFELRFFDKDINQDFEPEIINNEIDWLTQIQKNNIYEQYLIARHGKKEGLGTITHNISRFFAGDIGNRFTDKGVAQKIYRFLGDNKWAAKLVGGSALLGAGLMALSTGGAAVGLMAAGGGYAARGIVEGISKGMKTKEYAELTKSYENIYSTLDTQINTLKAENISYNDKIEKLTKLFNQTITQENNLADLREGLFKFEKKSNLVESLTGLVGSVAGGAFAYEAIAKQEAIYKELIKNGMRLDLDGSGTSHLVKNLNGEWVYKINPTETITDPHSNIIREGVYKLLDEQGHKYADMAANIFGKLKPILSTANIKWFEYAIPSLLSGIDLAGSIAKSKSPVINSPVAATREPSTSEQTETNTVGVGAGLSEITGEKAEAEKTDEKEKPEKQIETEPEKPLSKEEIEDFLDSLEIKAGTSWLNFNNEQDVIDKNVKFKFKKYGPKSNEAYSVENINLEKNKIKLVSTGNDKSTNYGWINIEDLYNYNENHNLVVATEKPEPPVINPETPSKIINHKEGKAKLAELVKEPKDNPEINKENIYKQIDDLMTGEYKYIHEALIGNTFGLSSDREDLINWLELEVNPDKKPEISKIITEYLNDKYPLKKS